MYKFRISFNKPFWTLNNENKPSLKIFNEWKEQNLEEVENLDINFIDLFNIKIHSNFNNIKYIEITNLDNTNDTRYYFINSINQVGSANSYIMGGKIDSFTSWTLNFINDNLEKKLIFLRTHEYEKKCLLFEDQEINNLPKFYNSYSFVKRKFNYDENNKIWYSENLGIYNNDDLLNCNKYFVFKDGSNGGYRFFPIISNNRDNYIIKNEMKEKTKEEELFFKRGHFTGRDGQNESYNEVNGDVNEKITNAWKNNKIIKYFYKKATGGTSLSGWNYFSNLRFGAMPRDFFCSTNYYDQAGAGIRAISITHNYLGSQFSFSESKNFKAWQFNDAIYNCSHAPIYKVEIWNGEKITKTFKVKNSLSSLELMRTKTEFVNKFLGIFYIPHFLNFKNFSIDKKENQAFIEINPQGENFNLFPIFEYKMSNIDNVLNNKSYSNEYLLKYLNIKYYGNEIKAEFRTNNKHIIFLGGILLFTDAANLISKTSNLLSLENSIISYPYQLPIGSDTYQQYVGANRGVTDTQFDIAQQQSNMSIAKGLTEGATSIAGGAASIATGNIGGGVSQILSGATNMIFSPLEASKKLDQQKQMIRTQYQQARNTMGSKLLFSNIRSASLINYYDSKDGEQYEGVELSDLDENTLKLINNLIFLNGYFLPKASSFNERINNNRDFNFIQIDSILLQQALNLTINFKKINNQIYEIIKDELINGVRIWNKKEQILPEYNEDEEWPDQPNNEEDITPPPPPFQPEEERVSDFTLKNPQLLQFSYFNENREVVNAISLLLICGHLFKEDQAIKKPPFINNVINNNPNPVFIKTPNESENITITLNFDDQNKINSLKKLNCLINNNSFDRNAKYKYNNLTIKITNDEAFNIISNLSNKVIDVNQKFGGYFNNSDLTDISFREINIIKGESNE